MRPRERAGADRPFVFVTWSATVGRPRRGRGSSAALGDEADPGDAARAAGDRRRGADRHRHAARRGLGPAAAQPGAARAAEVAAGLAEDPTRGAAHAAVRHAVGGRAVPGAEQPVLIYTGSGAGGRPTYPRRSRSWAREATPAAAVGRAALARRARAGVRGRPDAARSARRRRARRRAVPDVAPLLTGDQDEPRIVAGGRLPRRSSVELLWALRSDRSCSCGTAYRVGPSNRGSKSARRRRRVRARRSDRARGCARPARTSRSPT